MKSFAPLLMAVVLVAPGYVSASPKVADFAQHPTFEDVTISPNGDYLATKVHLKNGIGLAVIRLKDNKITATVTMRLNEQLYRYDWVGPYRLVMQPAGSFSTLDAPVPLGELTALNVDDSDEQYLIGTLSSQIEPFEVQSAGPHVVEVNIAVDMLARIPGDPAHALIKVTDLGNSHLSAGGLLTGDADTQSSSVCKMDLEKGDLSSCIAAPKRGSVDFAVDQAGAVRFAFGDRHMWSRNPDDSQWHLVTGALEGATPLRFSGDNSRLHLRMNDGGDRGCLVELTLADNKRRTLNCDPVGDLAQVIYSFDGKEAIAAFYNYDHPKLEFLDTGNHDKAVLQQLEASFPGEIVLPVSESDDGSRVVLSVYSDRDPGGYYLFDTKTMQVSPLAAVMKNIVPEEMGERRPISYKSRDGKTIHGYLTIPPGQQPKSLPLVMLPHGGPTFVADNWGWDEDAQLLATHGYAVLQVNFRGSSGYGDAFVSAGKKNWNTGMIADITDGVRWAIQQGYVDPRRICIFGASYGGYAALMSAEQEPDLYRCAIGYAGVYDLNLLLHGSWSKPASDLSDSRVGRDFFSEYVGSAPDELRAASPVNGVDRLKAAVMIVHGTDDTLAPFDQAKALRAALDARHYPYEWLVKSGEGHGFYEPADREDLYNRLLAFLDRNIGAGAAQANVPGVDSGSAAAQAKAP